MDINEVKSYRRKFLAPKSHDEDVRRQEYILNVLLVGSIAVLAFFDVLVLLYSIHRGTLTATNVSVEIVSIFLAFFIFLYALSRRGFFASAAYLLIAIYLAGGSYAAFRWGAAMPTALLSYAVIIIIASILIGTRFGFVVTVVMAIYVFPLWYLQLHRILPIDPVRFSVGDDISLVALYVLIMIAAWLSNREIEKSLLRARKSEHELKEERTQALYRFAEFGQLASGLFHDLLNMLNVIALRLENEERGIDDAKAVLKDARDVRDEVARFKDAMNKQLGCEDVRETFSLRQSVDAVLRFLSYRAKLENVSLEFQDSRQKERDDDFLYFGSPFKFHQVLMNLILNAIESFEGLDTADARARIVVIGLERKPGGSIKVTVKDNGAGIDEGHQPRIFEPFFTTKDAGRNGIGIGLAMVRRIIESDFGGNVAFETQQGIRSIFTVELPSNTEKSGHF